MKVIKENVELREMFYAFNSYCKKKKIIILFKRRFRYVFLNVHLM